MDGDHHILAGAVDLIGWIGGINAGLVFDVDPVAEADLFSCCQVLRERVVDADGPILLRKAGRIRSECLGSLGMVRTGIRLDGNLLSLSAASFSLSVYLKA